MLMHQHEVHVFGHSYMLELSPGGPEGEVSVKVCERPGVFAKGDNIVQAVANAIDAIYLDITTTWTKEPQDESEDGDKIHSFRNIDMGQLRQEIRTLHGKGVGDDTLSTLGKALVVVSVIDDIITGAKLLGGKDGPALRMDKLIYGNAFSCRVHGRICPTTIIYSDSGAWMCPTCKEEREA